MSSKNCQHHPTRTQPRECPFSPRYGYTTEETRDEYLETNFTINIDSNSTGSIDADLDTSKPLYFWQLYSIWGKQPIIDICSEFYNSVYNDDEEPWFRLVFQQTGTKERHILAQAAYWIDSMGGGKLYHGGLGRLKFHHSYNARHVMNSTGASRWMYHMKVSIIKNRHHFVKDPRILPCIVLDFLKTKMQSLHLNSSPLQCDIL